MEVMYNVVVCRSINKLWTIQSIASRDWPAHRGKPENIIRPIFISTPCLIGIFRQVCVYGFANILAICLQFSCCVIYHRWRMPELESGLVTCYCRHLFEANSILLYVFVLRLLVSTVFFFIMTLVSTAALEQFELTVN